MDGEMDLETYGGWNPTAALASGCLGPPLLPPPIDTEEISPRLYLLIYGTVRNIRSRRRVVHLEGVSLMAGEYYPPFWAEKLRINGIGPSIGAPPLPGMLLWQPNVLANPENDPCPTCGVAGCDGDCQAFRDSPSIEQLKTQLAELVDKLSRYCRHDPDDMRDLQSILARIQTKRAADEVLAGVERHADPCPECHDPSCDSDCQDEDEDEKARVDAHYFERTDCDDPFCVTCQSGNDCGDFQDLPTAYRDARLAAMAGALLTVRLEQGEPLSKCLKFVDLFMAQFDAMLPEELDRVLEGNKEKTDASGG